MKNKVVLLSQVRLYAAAIVFCLILFSGCGKNEKFAPAPMDQSASNYNNVTGNAKVIGNSEVSSVNEKLSVLRKSIETLPMSDLKIIDEKSDILSSAVRDRLMRIAREVRRDISLGAYNRAMRRSELRFVQRVDGNSGGTKNDDFIIERGKNISVHRMITVIINKLSDCIDSGGAGAPDCAMSDYFRQEMLTEADHMVQYLAVLPLDYFSGSSKNLRLILSGLTGLSMDCLDEDEPRKARNILREIMLPLVDGNAGGVTEDDLVINSAIKDEIYSKTIEIIQELDAMLPENQ